MSLSFFNSTLGHEVPKQFGALPSVTAYSATKHGITALCKGLRFDVQKIPDFKIRITVRQVYSEMTREVSIVVLNLALDLLFHSSWSVWFAERQSRCNADEHVV